MSEKEYNECVDLYADNVYRFILKNIKHKENAEDIVQNSFEVLWLKRLEVRKETSKSFLFTIAYRKMIDQIRTSKQLYSVDNTENHFSTTTKLKLNDVLDKALNTLDETKKALVLLKDYEGYSYDEIGNITGLSSAQVKVYLHRARLQLRNYIGKIENVL
ncbi:MAG: RNA polymerase sigma factor [Bacteroidia bacterium]|nr:MAG: RNA polymerase sigma factor [Bacteroidia bacterium]